MKNAYLIVYLSTLEKNWQGKKCLEGEGFTLIELLVVIIILGVMVAIALPNLINQIGRSREAEAKMILSTIGQSQQAYFFENASFADSYEALETNFQSNHYTFDPPVLINSVITKTQANAKNAVASNTRNFGLGVYYENFTYQIILCRSIDPSTTTVAPDTAGGVCSNSGEIEN